MANMLAFVVLLSWPLISLGLFLTLPVQRAIIWSLLLSFLFLPPFTQIDPPLLPPFDKNSVPAFTALLLALVMAKRGAFRWPRSAFLNILLIVAIFSPLLTGFSNRAPIIIIDSFRPGFDLYTSGTAAFMNLMRLIPFILAVGYLRTERDHRDLLLAMVILAVVYSILVLIEIRLSPQFLRWFYNIQNQYFLQQVRNGGFRAMVFLGHGLLVSDYIAISAIAATALVRRRAVIFGVPMSMILLYLIVILALNKSLGAFSLALLLVPAVYFLRPNRVLLVGVVISCIVLSFPLTRTLGVAPTNFIEAVAGKVSAERAASYAFRARNEDALLARAEEKPVFGWGSFGRSRVIIETDWGEARDISTTDGLWIIVFGEFGWVGFLALFGLLSYPLWRALSQSRRLPLPPTSLALAGIVIYYLIDMLPNAQETPILWMCAGALTGLVAPQRLLAHGRRAVRHGSAPGREPEAVAA